VVGVHYFGPTAVITMVGAMDGADGLRIPTRV
jgi:hypothetical protein